MSSKQAQATDGTLDQDVSTLLHRIDPARNEARFYFVSIGPALFDPHAVIRIWGRIGGYQRLLVTPCQTSTEARKLAKRLVQRRLKRGYKLIQGAALTISET